MKKPSPEKEQLRRKLIDEILNYVAENQLRWPRLQEKFGFKTSDYSSFSKLSQYLPSYDKVEEFHNIIFKNPLRVPIQISNDDVGHYVRDEYRKFEGRYALIRPSIHEKSVIYGYFTELYWDASDRKHKLHLESPNSILEEGTVFFIKDLQSVCIHFNDRYMHGMLLLKYNVGDLNLYGSMLSLLPTTTEHHFAPACTPVVLVKQQRSIPLGTGHIAPGHELYEDCLKLITSVQTKDVVMTGWWSS